MAIRYLFTDVDGTLVSGVDTICQKNIEAVQRAYKAGIKMILTSGRVPCIMDCLYEKMGIPRSDKEYMICANGALIRTTAGDHLFESVLDHEVMRRFIDYVFSFPGTLLSSADEENYYRILRSADSGEYDEYSTLFLTREEFLSLKDTGFYKFRVDAGIPEVGDRIIREIGTVTNGALCASYSEPYILEVHNNDCNKGNAIRFLASLMGAKEDEILCIGDNFNDLEMFKTCHFKACPSNATKEIALLSDYVSPFSCETGAVGDIIDSFVFPSY